MSVAACTELGYSDSGKSTICTIDELVNVVLHFRGN